MINYFRRIRKNILAEGRTGRYLKYALGEIILVVIGILIALQINNWNSERIAQKQMNAYLHGIIEDLKSDTLQFSNRIKYFHELAQRNRKVLSLTHFEDISADSLYLALRPRLADYVINATTFDKITSSGITQISKNDSLSKKVYEYYTNGPTNLKSFMVWDKESSTETAYYLNFGPHQFEINLVGYQLEEDDKVLNFQDEAIRKRNLVQLLTEPIGRNHFKLAYARKQTIANRLVRFKEVATNLIVAVEKELNESK